MDKKTTMKNSVLLILLLSSILSCAKKDPKPKCGCEGAVHRILTDEAALYSKGFLMVKKQSWYDVLDCNPIVDNSSIADGDSVVVSGKVRQSCSIYNQDINTFIALPTPLEVTAIRKK